MSIGAVPPISATPASASAAASENSLDKLDYNAFLKLLVEQMKNQDPTEPMDSTAYLAQLATFANVEQNTKTNAKLDAILAATSVAQAASLIGRTVTSADGSVSGKVSGYEIFANGVKLALENGGELTLGPGVRVSGQ